MTRHFRSLYSRLTPRVAILLYHRIASHGSDPRLLVSPQNFAAHVRIAAELAACIPLRDLPSRLARPISLRPAVVFSFDDGYADNLHAAKPILTAARVPATVFVATLFARHGSEFWWDELERLGVSPEERVGHVDVLRRLADADRDCYLRAVGSSPSRGQSGEPQAPRAMNHAELRELARGGLIEIGGHTVSHPHLASLPADHQRLEIRGCKEELEGAIGSPVVSFAYPFGHRGDDYTAKTVHSVGESGFTIACTTNHGIARRGSQLLELPRFWVEDWDGVEFRRRLKSWLRYSAAS